jgi:hypothetical protein
MKQKGKKMMVQKHDVRKQKEKKTEGDAEGKETDVEETELDQTQKGRNRRGNRRENRMWWCQKEKRDILPDQCEASADLWGRGNGWAPDDLLTPSSPHFSDQLQPTQKMWDIAGRIAHCKPIPPGGRDFLFGTPRVPLCSHRSL